MKNQKKFSQKLQLTALTFALSILQFTATAQDKLIDIDIGGDNDFWYQNPYIWVGVGVLILLIVLVAKRK